MSIKAYLAVAMLVYAASASAQSKGHGHRSKRYFFINPDAPITLG